MQSTVIQAKTVDKTVSLTVFAKETFQDVFQSLKWYEAENRKWEHISVGRKTYGRTIRPKAGYYCDYFGTPEGESHFYDVIEDGDEVTVCDHSRDYFGQVLPRTFQRFKHWEYPEHEILWIERGLYRVLTARINKWNKLKDVHLGWGGGDRTLETVTHVGYWFWDGVSNEVLISHLDRKDMTETSTVHGRKTHAGWGD